MKVIDCALLLHLNRAGEIPAKEIPAMVCDRPSAIAAGLGVPRAKIKHSLDGLVGEGKAAMVIWAGNREGQCHR